MIKTTKNLHIMCAQRYNHDVGNVELVCDMDTVREIKL